MPWEEEETFVKTKQSRFYAVLHTFYPDRCWDLYLDSIGHPWSPVRSGILKWLSKQSDFVLTEWDELLIQKLLEQYDSEF